MMKELFPYQQEGKDKLLSQKKVLLADEPGLGKTVQVTAALQELRLARPDIRVLVVTPYSTMSTWYRHFFDWATAFRDQVVIAQEKQTVIRRKNFDQAYQERKACIVNYEGLLSILSGFPANWFKFDVVVLDESHRVRNRKTKTFRMLKTLLANRPEYVWALTGTPQVNSTDDLWAQLHLIDRSRWSSYWRFCTNYCHVIQGPYGYIVQSIADPEHPRKKALSSALEPYLLRRFKSDVLKDLPAKIISERWADLDGPSRKDYLDIERTMCVQIAEFETVTIQNVLSQILRMRQVLIDPTLIIPKDNALNSVESPLSEKSPKIRLLKDVLEGQGKWPILIFSQFAHVLKRLQNNLNYWGYESDLYIGETPVERRTAIEKRFQSEGQPQILLVSTMAGGVGLTLTRASTAVYLDKMWSPAYNTQSQDRIHRVGAEDTVHIIELLISGTIEEKINKLLSKKESMDFSLWEAMYEMYEVNRKNNG